VRGNSRQNSNTVKVKQHFSSFERDGILNRFLNADFYLIIFKKWFVFIKKENTFAVPIN
jgi:hypothetical protein